MIRNILKVKKRTEMINSILERNEKGGAKMKKDILKKGLNLAVALIFGFNTIAQAQPLKLDTLRPVSLGNAPGKGVVGNSLKSSSAGKEFRDNTIKELQEFSFTLNITESALVRCILSSLIPSQLITDIAEAGGRPTMKVVAQLTDYPMLKSIIARYQDKKFHPVSGDYRVDELVDFISKISKQQNASIQRMADIVFNCIEPTTFVKWLAVTVKTERPDKDVAKILQHNPVLALVGTSYRVLNLKEEADGNMFTLRAEDIVDPDVVSEYASKLLDIEVTLPEGFQVDNGIYNAVMVHFDQVAAAAQKREYNYRGGVYDYYKRFMQTEVRAYNRFIKKNFGSKEKIKYLITSGIGANEMYSHLMAALHNSSGKGPRWIVVDAPSDIKNLPEGATAENTLFFEMSRSGSTQETLKLLQLTYKRFPKRVVYANKGPLRKQAESLRDKSDYPILVRDVAQDIGGRLMRRRTPLLLGPMYLAGMDTASYFKATDEFDRRLDFAKGPDSLAVSLARFLYICVVLDNRHNMALMYNNRQLLGPSAKEIRQLWMEGANKKAAYSLIMSTHEFPRDPHASMEGVFGQAASHIGFGIVARHSGSEQDKKTVITDTDLEGLRQDPEQQHAGLSIDDMEYAFAVPHVQKCQKVMPTISIKMDSVTPQTASALTTLYEDTVVHYCALTGQDPNSNPQVKLVREDTADLLRQIVQDKGSTKSSSAGRDDSQNLPRVSITAAREAYRYIGVSMGGNKLAVSINDGNNDMIDSKELRWDDDDRFKNSQVKQVSKANEVMDTLVEMIIGLLEGNNIAGSKIGIVATGLAGPVDKEKGIFGSDFKTPNLPFDKYPFREELIRRLSNKGIDVQAEMCNDGEAARNGERFSPQGQLRGIPGGIVIIGGGINISVDDESIKECGHNLYQVKDKHYIWVGDRTKGGHPIERGNTDAEIKKKSGVMGEEYVSLGEQGFRDKYPDYPFIEWADGLRDFEDRLSGPNIRARLKAAINDAKQYQPPDLSEYIAIEETASKLERKGELERALTPEALKGNKVAIRWIKDIGAEIGRALAAFISAYRKEDFAKHLVLVSGVSENLGKGVYKNKGDKVDIFMKALRQSAEDELVYFDMSKQEARKAVNGVVRSKMDYSRELVAYQPTDDEVRKAYLSAIKSSSAGSGRMAFSDLPADLDDREGIEVFARHKLSTKGVNLILADDLMLVMSNIVGKGSKETVNSVLAKLKAEGTVYQESGRTVIATLAGSVPINETVRKTIGYVIGQLSGKAGRVSKSSSAGQAKDISAITEKLTQPTSALVSAEAAKLDTAILDAAVSAYQEAIDKMKTLKAESAKKAAEVAEPLKVAEASLGLMTLSKDIAVEEAKIKQATGTIIINDAEIPANQKILLTLLDKKNSYLKALEEKLGCKIRLLSQFDLAKDASANMVAISTTKIPAVSELRYLDISRVTDDAYLPLEQAIVLAKGLLVYAIDNSDVTKGIIAQMYRLLAKKPAEQELFEQFLNKSVFSLVLPSPTPVDEKYYGDLHRQAIAALIAA